MAAATQSNLAATGAWQDITVALPAAANTDVLLQNTGLQPVKVCFGGAAAPASDLAGVTLARFETIMGNAANVWVRSPGGSTLAISTGHSGGIGGVYNASLPTLASGQRGDAQLSSKGELLAALSSAGNVATIGSTSADAVSASLAALAVAARGYAFNGATWDRFKKPGSTARLLSAAATTNATSVKTAAADLFRVRGYNAAAAARYLKLYNKASAPTVGTDTPVATYYLPPAAPFELAFDTPLYFGTGLAYALTGAAADSDTTALAAGDVLCLNLHYA